MSLKINTYFKYTYIIKFKMIYLKRVLVFFMNLNKSLKLLFFNK
jgi:hypothetical protein